MRYLLLAVVLAGCGGGPNYEGVWIGERQVEARPGSDPTIVRTLSKIRLEIQPGGRFTMIDAGMGKAGDIRYADGKALLKVRTMLGQEAPEAPEIALTPQDDGTLVYDDPAGFETAPVIMKRESQPGR